FSGIQFMEKDFVKNMQEILEEFGLDPSFLIIEITETNWIDNTDKVKEDIQKLRSLGVCVALDDFGASFSSLSRLASFDIDMLKIEKCFIGDLTEDESCEVITKHIINLAHDLNIKLVAEGIEKWEQLTTLQEYNCYAGQGYIYSKPLPVEEIEKILAQGKCYPKVVGDIGTPRVEKRKFFRINFIELLEADMTIKEIKGKRVNIGNSKVLIKNMGPGGLCYLSNIRLPLDKGIFLQFTTQLLGEDIKLYGTLVWKDELGPNLYEYGVEFVIDEKDRADLIMILNQVQIKLRNRMLLDDGNFTALSPEAYFRMLKAN
ncbi:MAG: EAL domain-containing protein, partial [Desulfitobacterium sp.]|nr:EAL domain-containing protein [Desulfitobacterium sp.]